MKCVLSYVFHDSMTYACHVVLDRSSMGSRKPAKWRDGGVAQSAKEAAQFEATAAAHVACCCCHVGCVCN